MLKHECQREAPSIPPVPVIALSNPSILGGLFVFGLKRERPRLERRGRPMNP